MAINDIPATNEAHYGNIKASEPPNGIEVDTPRGKETDEWENQAKVIFENHYTNSKLIRAPVLSVIDWFIVKDGKLIGVCEHKTRLNLTPLEMYTQHGGKWLLSANKLNNGQLVAKHLSIDLWGSIYFKDSAVLMMVKLWSASKNQWLQPYEIKETETQKGVNGGRAIRENAYITLPQQPLLIK
jgi:hypothetical protein